MNQLRGIAVFKALSLPSKSLFQNSLSTELTSCRDVGLWRPIDQLPGCNPLWKSNVATKPTCGPQLTRIWLAPMFTLRT